MGIFLGSKKQRLCVDNSSVSPLIYKIPNEYQEVEWICAKADVEAYIDLGFTFDTKAKIYISQWIDNDVKAYPFGATENSGTHRCCLSSPYGSKSTLYGSNGSAYREATASYIVGKKNNIILTLEPGNLNIDNKTSGISSTTTTQASYTMTNSLYLFAQNYNGTARFGGIRKIGYFRYHDKNDKLICELFPCRRKSDGVIGMYDFVRGMFLTNVGSGTFTRPYIGMFTNQVPISIDTDGSVYNGVGYVNDVRLNSSGGYTNSSNHVHTGYIPSVYGDVLRCETSALTTWTSGGMYIAFYKSDFTLINILATKDLLERYGGIENTYDGGTRLTYDTINLSSSRYGETAFIRVSSSGIGANLIVTINEEIE